MKRRNLLSNLLLFVIALSASAESEATIQVEFNTQELLPFFYSLWRRSGYGMASDLTESAAWVIRNAEGKCELIYWPITPESKRVSWSDAIPWNAIAAAHTHPRKLDPKPSRHDTVWASKLRMPVFTITADGIWKVTPDGKVTQEADLKWDDELKESSPIEK
jgi:hypothetical protein